MVLLAGPGPEGGGARCLSPQPPTAPRGAETGDDPADYEEYEDFSSLADTRSIASDDSFYPPEGEDECSEVSSDSVSEGFPEAATFLRAACANDVGLLQALVRRGPRVEEVQETDRNGRVSGRPRRAVLSSLSTLFRPGTLQVRAQAGPAVTPATAPFALCPRSRLVLGGFALPKVPRDGRRCHPAS